MGQTGWQLFSLVTAALIAGYAFATAAGIFIGSILPLPRGEAVLAGSMLSLLCYPGAIIWAFTLRRPKRVWLGLTLSACLLAAAGIIVAGPAL